MYSLKESRAAKYIAVLTIGLVAGGLLWGNLFTFATGELNGVGPGFGQQIGLKVDTVTTITTSDPSRYTGQSVPAASWLVERIWQLTGKMWMEPTGEWTILWSRHAGVLMNDGKDWLEDQISDTPSAATIAKWIALTRDAHTPVATDERLWAEIDTGGGLDKAEGTYASTGVGTWTVTKQFTADAAYIDVQATGLHWTTTGSENNTMLCADTFTPVTLANGDKVTVTWTVTIS